MRLTAKIWGFFSYKKIITFSSLGFFFPERIEVGGSSPFYDAFLVALAALEKKGEVVVH